MNASTLAPVLTVNGYRLAVSRVLNTVTVSLLAPWDPDYRGYRRAAEVDAYADGDADTLALDLYYRMLDACNAGAARDLPYSPEFTRALLAFCYCAADKALAA